ncbi:TPA: ribose 5-phosphate isomerase B [Listeria monocytogenes]|uniref:Ribose 5-phosphate isomerase B n=5 Tax=Listeria TaxID=1637 RepID=A0A3A2UXS2_LISMN|nr:MULTISPECIES: ribose 5-phosphate isomerase B [Listeria]EAE6068494.1 ribose 5-phosphate isomerase B [Listeria monocytogenes serotype 1/2a]EAG6290801.1 ribose 5-phosphate isomerase B [Listeria monocytogenes CFSAN003825]EAG6318055.1 ribose 5-phosphate isomerase B [Listeria monocytogenes CFSAN003824]EAG6342445.1 ribose 5-phosphate isomerase B [Listeria monocytogenes CFSAN003811]EEP3930782.1 ribose 5-phosphate isomerase B [Listeria monocytogenes serotype 4ab]EFD91588.1 ribose 5-phosphate isomer
MKIAIGCDEMGYELKQTLIARLKEKNIEFTDFGSFEDEKVLYPSIAEKVALEVKNNDFDRGILICGTGIGMAITANKIHGIRAAQIHDSYSAERARKSNDAHIMTMGALVIGPSLAVSLLDTWLDSDFSGGRSQAKVDLMEEIDQKNR